MSKKSLEERLAELEARQGKYVSTDEKYSQIAKQMQAAEAREKNKAKRKERTHRLIKIGGAVESLLNSPLGDEELNVFLERMRQLEISNQDGNKTLLAAGKIIEEILGRELTDRDLPKLRRFLFGQEKRGFFFSKFMNQETE